MVYNYYYTYNVRITGIIEEEREKGAERLFKEIVAENITNLGKDLHIQVYETKRSRYCINRHVMQLSKSEMNREP